MDFCEKMKVKNWNQHEGCQFGCKVWGHFEDGVFMEECYKKGDFPIVWCQHDGKPCDVEQQYDCCIKQDHDEE